MRDFFTAPFNTAEMNPNYLRGVWFPIIINFLTKGSSKPFEQESSLQTSDVSHAAIALVLLNVAVKAGSMNAMLPNGRSPYLKVACFLTMISFDVITNLLFAQQRFNAIFPQPSQAVQYESWATLAVLDIFYMVFIAQRHRLEARENSTRNNLLQLEAGQTDLLENTEAQSLSRLTWTVNQVQLPLKFLTGLVGFFYGIKLGEQTDWPLQLPLSSIFYGSAMALTQTGCNLIKREKNWELVLYALACGFSEGIAYFSTLRFLPDEMHTIIKSLIVAVSTTTCIFLAGNAMFLLLQKMQKEEETHQANEQTLLAP